MNRAAVLPAAELMALAHHIVRKHLPEEQTLADYRLLINPILDEYCYGFGVVRDFTITERLTEWDVPVEACEQIEKQLSDVLIGAIQQAFTIIYPARHYNYRWVGEDLIVEESVCIPILSSSSRTMVDSIDELEQDETSFTPERLRRRSASSS